MVQKLMYYLIFLNGHGSGIYLAVLDFLRFFLGTLAKVLICYCTQALTPCLFLKPVGVSITNSEKLVFIYI